MLEEITSSPFFNIIIKREKNSIKSDAISLETAGDHRCHRQAVGRWLAWTFHSDRRATKTNILPALTIEVWRVKINVITAANVKSHRRLFVFHLMVHLCISMVKRPQLHRKRATFLPFLKKSTENRLILQRHEWKFEDFSFRQTGPLRFTCAPPPLSPALTLMVKDFHEKKKKKAQDTFLPENCAPSGGRTNAATLRLSRLQGSSSREL